jgi:hypothetical protein
MEKHHVLLGFWCMFVVVSAAGGQPLDQDGGGDRGLPAHRVRVRQAEVSTHTQHTYTHTQRRLSSTCDEAFNRMRRNIGPLACAGVKQHTQSPSSSHPPRLTNSPTSSWLLLLLCCRPQVPPEGRDPGQDLLPAGAHQDKAHGAGHHPARVRGGRCVPKHTHTHTHTHTLLHDAMPAFFGAQQARISTMRARP